MKHHSVLIIYKHAHPPARQEAVKLEQWLKRRGVEACSQEMEAMPAPCRASAS